MKHIITPDKSVEPSERSDMFVMKEGSAWITAGSVSVRIEHDGENVRVSLLPFGHEMDETFGEIEVSQRDARSRIEQLKGNAE